MSIRGSIVVCAAMLAGSVASAGAADLNMGMRGSVKDGIMPAVEHRSVYMRLDGAYGSFDAPVMIENGIYSLSDTAIDSTWSIGGGIGTYFGRNVRGDITVDYRFGADARGAIIDPAATLPGMRRFGLDSTVVLANLYYDFDLGNRINPYLGVGLGVVRHKTSQGTVDTCGCTTAIIESGESWSVAGALMAGVSVAVRSNMHLDAGYRFLYLGETTTGAVIATGTPLGAVSYDPTVEDIHAHEFRFGLRYDIR